MVVGDVTVNCTSSSLQVKYLGADDKDKAITQSHAFCTCLVCVGYTIKLTHLIGKTSRNGATVHTEISMNCALG